MFIQIKIFDCILTKKKEQYDGQVKFLRNLAHILLYTRFSVHDNCYLLDLSVVSELNEMPYGIYTAISIKVDASIGNSTI